VHTPNINHPSVGDEFRISNNTHRNSRTIIFDLDEF
jgi:hypothetical protein